jgi:hypothetical protein
MILDRVHEEFVVLSSRCKSYRHSLFPVLIRHPACSSIPKPFRWFASRVPAIELTAFEHISRRAIPRLLLGLERSPDFGRISSKNDIFPDLRVEIRVSPKL